MTYESAYEYIDSSTTIQEKITKIDQVINALYDTAIKSASNDNISEYWLNDGQTQIKTVYKGTDQVMKSIKDFEMLRDMLVVKYNKRNIGSVYRLVDGKNFTGR